jgi:hypothetical protein
MHRLLLLVIGWTLACAQDPTEPVQDAGPSAPAAPADAGVERCGTAGPDFADGLIELSWDDGSVGEAPYSAVDLSFMTSPYNGGTELPSAHEQWEAVRFELEHPATVHAVRVRLTALGNLREDDEHGIGLYGDFGYNGFDFDQWNPLWEGTRCGVDITRDEWVTFALDEPLSVPHAGLIFAANHRLDARSPRLVFAQNRSEECANWEDCHSAWNFPQLDPSFYNGPSFPLPYNYAVRLLVEYHEALPEQPRFTSVEDLSLSNRSSWADYDEDGWEDVAINGPKLYRNVGSQGTPGFEEVTERVGLGAASGSPIWGDLNNDGCLDLVVFGGREQIFESDCSGGFVDVTSRSGVDDRQIELSCSGQPNEHASTMAAALYDFDGDGWLDIYLGNGECWRDNRGEYYADRIFKNRGDGTFVDFSGARGFPTARTYSRAIAPADYDADGHMDLLVGNYRLQRNFLFKGRGDSVREVGLNAGIAGENVQGAYGHAIGAVWTDLNGDEFLDLVIGNLAHPRFYHFSDKTKVYLGQADGEFVDVSERAGIRFQETHSVPAAGDFNHDGFIDLAITAVYPGRPTDFLWGRGDGVFEDAMYGSGIVTTNGWGASVADADNDGDVDLALDRLYLNTGGDAGHWLQVRAIGLLGDQGVNRAALGALVRVEAGGRSFLRQVSGANGQGGQDALTLHYGLAEASEVERITVRFPGLEEQVVIEGPLDADQRVWVFADGSHGLGWTQPSP